MRRLTELPALPLIREMLLLDHGRSMIASTYETLEVFEVGLDNSLHWKQRVPLSPKNGPRMALAPPGHEYAGRMILVGYFDGPPELYARTYRVFGIDLWPPSFIGARP